MADETQNQPAGAQAGQPASGGKTPAASEKHEQGGDDDRLTLRQRAIEAERKLSALESKLKKDDDARLAEQGKHQELAKRYESEASTWKDKYVQAQRNNALITAGAKAGIKDAGDLVLAKLGDVDVDDGDALREAAEKAIGELHKVKPYLFGSDNPKPNQAATGKQPPAGGDKPVSVPAGVKRDDVAKLSPEQKQALAGSFFDRFRS